MVSAQCVAVDDVSQLARETEKRRLILVELDAVNSVSEILVQRCLLYSQEVRFGRGDGVVILNGIVVG